MVDAGERVVGVRAAGGAGRAERGGVVPPDGVEDAGGRVCPEDRGSPLAGGDRVAGRGEQVGGLPRGVAGCEGGLVDLEELADDVELLGESQVEELEGSDGGGLGVRNSSGSELSWYEEEDEVFISCREVENGVLCLVFFV